MPVSAGAAVVRPPAAVSPPASVSRASFRFPINYPGNHGRSSSVALSLSPTVSPTLSARARPHSRSNSSNLDVPQWARLAIERAIRLPATPPPSTAVVAAFADELRRRVDEMGAVTR